MYSAFPSFYRLLNQHRFSYPLQEAVVCGDTRLSFGELYDRVNRVANAMAALGVTESSRILWLGQNSHALLEIFLACSRLGASFCLVNWRQSAAEIAFVLRDFDPALVFWQEMEFAPTVSDAKIQAPGLASHWISLDGQGSDGYRQLLADASPEGTDTPAAPDTGRALLVLYTGAFGGQPNGAQISEPGLFLQSLVHVNVFEATSDTKTLVSAPTFHITSWLDMLPTFIAGGTLCFARSTDAGEILDLIGSERLTNGTVQPPTAKKIAELNADGSHDLSCFRSPLTIPGWTEMTSRGPGISGTGQTEVVGPVIVGAFAGEGSTPFCGRPAPMVEAKVVDDTGAMVGAGEVGELVIRGPVAGLGYWNRPELNAERLSADGWWHTRDLARRDRDGTISFVGPKSQMVKSGGENVYAAEVENVLKTHPAVTNAAIIGTPDADWGQLVTAVVVTKPDLNVTVEELQEFVRSRIARYKTPRIIHFAPELPLNGFAIDYKALDREFGGGGYPGEEQKNGSNIGATVRK